MWAKWYGKVFTFSFTLPFTGDPGENPVRYKLILTFKCLHGAAPSYLADEFIRSLDSKSRSSLLSVIIDRSTNVGYTFVDCWRPSFSGRRCRVLNDYTKSCLRHPCEYFAVVRKLIFSPTFCSAVPVKWLLSLSGNFIAFVTYLLSYPITMLYCVDGECRGV